MGTLIFGSGAFSTTGLLIALGIIIGAIVLVAGVVFVQTAERRVPVQYAKKRYKGRKMVGAQNYTYTIKTCHGRCNASNFASSFDDISSNGFTNIYKKTLQTATRFRGGIYKFFNSNINIRCSPNRIFYCKCYYISITYSWIYIFLYICNI